MHEIEHAAMMVSVSRIERDADNQEGQHSLMWQRPSLVRRLVLASAVLAAAGLALLWYASSDPLPPPDSMALLESIMPGYDMQEVHSIFVDASPANAYAAILAVTPGEIALARPFMWLRTVPARISGAPGGDGAFWHRPFLSLPGTGVLGETRDKEIVIGLIGKFWRLRNGVRVAVQGREHFMAFNDPGFAVSTLSFHINPQGAGSRVTTITRVRTTDADSRRVFLRYWRFIGAGSGLLRRTWLRAVKARAERQR